MNREQLVILEKFHAACVRFWKEFMGEYYEPEPYLKALEDVRNCKTNPYKAHEAESLDPRTREYFIKRCEMDLGLSDDFKDMKWEQFRFRKQ